jgi:hypothetical protein
MIDLNAYYREHLDQSDRGTHYAESAGDIAPGAKLAILQRTKDSHRGIEQCRELQTLCAEAVNQDYLDRICTLDQLERLDLGWPVTAPDLSGLRRLTRLRYLRIDSPRAVTDFSPLLELPALTALFIENAKHLHALDWLAPLGQQLKVLGVEGSTWTAQKLESLRPLADCPDLKYLGCARFAPKEEFEALKALRPDISCQWFVQYEIG